MRLCDICGSGANVGEHMFNYSLETCESCYLAIKAEFKRINDEVNALASGKRLAAVQEMCDQRAKERTDRISKLSATENLTCESLRHNA